MSRMGIAVGVAQLTLVGQVVVPLMEEDVVVQRVKKDNKARRRAGRAPDYRLGPF